MIATGVTTLLIARIRGEHFAFDVDLIEEAVDAAGLEPFPHLPAGALGVLRSRGVAHTVWSPEPLLRVAPVEPRTVLFLRAEDASVAMAVDDAEDLITLPHDHLRSLKGIDDGAGLVLGGFQTGETFATVVDVRVLAASLVRRDARVMEA